MRTLKNSTAPNKRTTTRTNATMSLASHALTAGLAMYFIYLSFKTYSLFSWHPACATIGCLLLMVQAIMAMSQDNVLGRGLSRQGRVQTHWALLVVAAGFVLASFIAIVVDKTHRGKHHFASIHAVVGLVSVILLAVASCGGAAVLYSARLKGFVKPATIKLGHAALGIVTFSTGVAALISGLYTNFFKREGGPASQTVCTIILVLVLILTLKSSVKSVYARIRSLS